MYTEASSKSNAGVQQCFEELVGLNPCLPDCLRLLMARELQVRRCLETPALAEGPSGTRGIKMQHQRQDQQAGSGWCC